MIAERKHIDKLAEDAKEAKANGMSYGNWMAKKMLEAPPKPQKTQETKILREGKPIVLSVETVKSILGGDDTTIIRGVKEKIEKHGQYVEIVREYEDGTKAKTRMGEKAYTAAYAPYQKNETIYVRETWAVNHITDDVRWLYKADYDTDIEPYCRWKWEPPTRMSKEAARIWLTVKDIKLQQLIPTDECEEGPWVWVISFERIEEDG